jgi:hypothetical protein
MTGAAVEEIADFGSEILDADFLKTPVITLKQINTK